MGSDRYGNSPHRGSAYALWSDPSIASGPGSSVYKGLKPLFEGLLSAKENVVGESWPKGIESVRFDFRAVLVRRRSGSNVYTDGHLVSAQRKQIAPQTVLSICPSPSAEAGTPEAGTPEADSSELNTSAPAGGTNRRSFLTAVTATATFAVLAKAGQSFGWFDP